MKIEATFELSEDLLATLRHRAPDTEARSNLVEVALRSYLSRLRRADASKDLAIINSNAEALNAEAEDVLSYQVLP